MSTGYRQNQDRHRLVDSRMMKKSASAEKVQAEGEAKM